jgi:hypothetical protein
VRSATDSLSTRLPLNRLEALELQLSRMGTEPVVRAAGARKAVGKPAGKAAERKDDDAAVAVKKPSAKVATRRKPK